MSDTCDFCGKPTNGKVSECRIGADWNSGGFHGCNGEDLWLDKSDDEVLREAMRAPLLRAALAEALDGWGRLDGERQQQPPTMERVQLGIDNWTVRARPLPESQAARIAELRAKFLGGK